MVIVKIIITLLAMGVFTAAGASELKDVSAVEKGLEIAVEADLRYNGFGDCEETFIMILRDSRGQERVRRLRVRTLERVDDGDWTMTIFDEPADVKGTAMLTYSHGVDLDDQWLYLPALKRVKRISSKKRSGSFMGSEFAFEDLSSIEVEKYTYKYLRKEPCAQLECFVSEWTPAYKHSGYSRMVVWHDTAEYRIQRTDYYDRRNNLLKTLKYTDYQLFNGRLWRPMHYDMVNHKTGKSTLLTYSAYRFGLGFTERDFDRNALKSAK